MGLGFIRYEYDSKMSLIKYVTARISMEDGITGISIISACWTRSDSSLPANPAGVSKITRDVPAGTRKLHLRALAVGSVRCATTTPRRLGCCPYSYSSQSRTEYCGS